MKSSYLTVSHETVHMPQLSNFCEQPLPSSPYLPLISLTPTLCITTKKWTKLLGAGFFISVTALRHLMYICQLQGEKNQPKKK